MRRLPAFLDPFTLALVATVVLAAVLPCRGAVAEAFDLATTAGIALLFFLHGARLSREAIVAGIVHWRLHLAVFASTFVAFPLFGLALKPVAPWLLTPELFTGVLFLCALPSTVQSSIAFTSIARGNVPAAVCSASLSNLLGVFLTPVLVSILLATHGDTGSPLDAIGKIALQLFAPFVAGHLARPWVGGWVERRRTLLSYTDRGTVLLVVYVAFSASVVEGLWQHVPLPALAAVAGVVIVLLAVALAMTMWGSRALGFSREDEIAIVFCGSKKSLASGVPIAKILFAGHPALGMVLLPVMLFHQVQLMACALLAQRYARRAQATQHTAR
ncbi:bile acid:sodium symporter family protein [Dokdonella sp. MW10]|uniref:bile acid:sodium symporter family protein n=1 Tax=Dokdonella sp. MW10 TaxID=2992926 RepID=UPI003F7D35E9